MLLLSGSFKEIVAVRTQVQDVNLNANGQRWGYRYFGMEEQDGSATLILEPVGADKAKRDHFISTLKKVIPNLDIK